MSEEEPFERSTEFHPGVSYVEFDCTCGRFRWMWRDSSPGTKHVCGCGKVWVLAEETPVRVAESNL